jgi:hypothetical protein
MSTTSATLHFILLVSSFRAELLVSAYPHYRSSLPNGNAFPAIGHVHAQQPDNNLNQFGLDFRDNLDWKQLCVKDSDGDGETNGQELGDPCCLWPKTPARLQQLSNPADRLSFSNSIPCPHNVQVGRFRIFCMHFVWSPF